LSKGMDWREYEGESNPIIPYEIVKYMHAILKEFKASLEQSPAVLARGKPMNPAGGANEGWARKPPTPFQGREEASKLTGTRITNFTAELLQYLAKTLNVQPLNDVMRCAEALEMHYIQARYPDARINDYRRWEAEEAIRCMEVVWSYVREVVGSVA